MKYDVIIIGGGPAGLSAALWCDDLGLEALVLEAGDELGGQLLWTHNRIENHLGTRAGSGGELRDRFVEQLAGRKFTVKLNSGVAGLDPEKRSIRLPTGEENAARALIIATGIRRRRLEVPGEQRLRGKGIIASGKRDRRLARGEHAVIIGGGDAAFENVLILSEVARRVTLIHRRGEFRARPEFTEPARRLDNVEILTDTVVKRIEGTDRVEAVAVENLKTGTIEQVPAGIVLVRIGVEPNTDFLPAAIELDRRGYVKIDHLCRTSADRIYAVGDVANPVSPTVSTAVGMGATAVKTISSLLI